jgi:hypothetical protein
MLFVLLSFFFWSLCCLSFCPSSFGIMLFVLLSFFWPLCCLSFCPSSFGHYVVCPFVLLLAIMSFVLMSFFWPLCCLSFCPSFGHYVACPSIYDFWLPLLYIQTFLDPCLIFIT